MHIMLYVRITRATDAEGRKKDTFRKTSQILPADNTRAYIYMYIMLCIYVHTGVGLNGPCVGMHPKSRVGLPTRVARTSVSGTRFIRNDSNIMLFTVE